jgi:hypothetical protein
MADKATAPRAAFFINSLRVPLGIFSSFAPLTPALSPEAGERGG